MGLLLVFGNDAVAMAEAFKAKLRGRRGRVRRSRPVELTDNQATPVDWATYDVENRMVEAVHRANGTERPVYPDRLGSMAKHYRYGEEPAEPANERTKFATCYRDTTPILNYARNRYSRCQTNVGFCSMSLVTRQMRRVRTWALPSTRPGLHPFSTTTLKLRAAACIGDP